MRKRSKKLVISILFLALCFYPMKLIPVVIILIVIPITAIIMSIISFITTYFEYKRSAYYHITKFPYFSVRHNTGRYGEYLTYQHLKHNETNGAKFLFNLYIPNGNGETTEIDVLMICCKGIFVFESKNYSGWIFGDENQKNWYQTLPVGRGRSQKEHFYNPIMQNHSHIKHLKVLLGEQFPMFSIIVFSDRCTLKNIQIRSNNVNVINRYNVAPVVSAICNQTPTDILSGRNITELYNKLYPFTQVDEIAKAQHIANIRSNLNGQPIRQTTPEYAPPVVATLQTEATTDTTIIQTEVNSLGVETVAEDVQSPVVESTKQIPIEVKPIEQQILKCPRCHGNLVLRTATRGANAGNQFYGCSNYPKCKYIQNITQKTV